MKNFDELNVLELDTIREIGSIGTGNAATALSSMLGCEVRIDVPGSESWATTRPLTGSAALR